MFDRLLEVCRDQGLIGAGGRQRTDSTHVISAVRDQQATKTWKTKYALRAGIEGTTNQALDVTGLRRARYRGLPKVRLQHALCHRHQRHPPRRPLEPRPPVFHTPDQQTHPPATNSQPVPRRV